VSNDSSLGQKEILGPVLSLIKADDEDHAIALANDTVIGFNNAAFSVNPQDCLPYRTPAALRHGWT
jgi:acyl-CoA reductase-like NAD-dependent aldehyde dehydrogenase